MSLLVDRCRSLIADRRLRPLLVLNLLLGSGYAFVGPFMSMFGTREVGMSLWMFGVFMTLVALGGIVLGTALALYSDTHFSRRSMLLLGSLCAVAGYVGYAYLRGVWVLTGIGAVVLGISSITFSQLFAYARETLGRAGMPVKETAFYLNAFRMFFALAWTVGPAIASWVMVTTGFRGLFLCAAANFLLFAVVVWRSVPAYPPAPVAAKRGQRTSFWRMMGRRDLLAHFVAFVAISCATTIAMMNLPLTILETLNGKETQVGIAYCVAPLFELPLMLYFGWLATRNPVAGIIRWGMVIAIVYYLILSAVRMPWHVYPVQILSAAVTAIISGVAITYFQSHLPHHPGTATNIYATATRVGSTGGFLLFSSLAAGFGHRVVFLGCAVLAVIGLALMLVPVHAELDQPDNSREDLDGPVTESAH